MKVLIRFFLSLCFLLINGYGSLYAYKVARVQASAAITHASVSESADSRLVFLKAAIPAVENDTDAIEIVDDKDEDEKASSFEKKEDLRVFISQSYGLLFSVYALRYLSIRVPFHTHFSYLSSLRYLRLRVLRL